MNKKIMSVMMLLVASLMAYGQNNKEVTFDYPIKPGTKEWCKFESTLDRVKALQIPQLTLTGLSTETLLDVCLDYPFLIELSLDDNYQKNLEIIVSQFNGLQELLNRSDLCDVLLAKNEQLMNEAPEMAKYGKRTQVIFAFKCFVVELLLTQDKLINSVVNRNKIIEVFKGNQSVRQKNVQSFRSINYAPSRILSEKGILDSPGILTYIINYSSTTVYTPKSHPVSALTFTGTDIGPGDDLYTEFTDTLNNHPGVTTHDTPTLKYNCHGFAWCYSESGPKVWINSPNHAQYWNDGSYIEVAEAIADKVVYSGDHSAVRVSSSLYWSKWGGGYLVSHSPNNVPSIYGSPTTYYMKAPSLSFTGPSFVSNTGTYTITGLQSGYTVEWSLSDSYYNSNCIQKNYPSANQCVITASSSHQMVNGTLTATIKKSGYTVTTLSKTVSAYAGFYGTYFNGQTTKQINLPNPLYVLPNTYVVINSPNLIGATVSYQGSFTPSAWQFYSSNGILRFGVSSNTGATLVITVTSNGDTYYLPVIVASNVSGISVSVNGGQINVSLVNDEADDFSKEAQLSQPETISWRIEVYNATTGEKVFNNGVEGSSFAINTTGWKPGIYVVNAIVGEQMFSEKIVVK